MHNNLLLIVSFIGACLVARATQGAAFEMPEERPKAMANFMNFPREPQERIGERRLRASYTALHASKRANSFSYDITHHPRLHALGDMQGLHAVDCDHPDYVVAYFDSEEARDAHKMREGAFFSGGREWACKNHMDEGRDSVVLRAVQIDGVAEEGVDLHDIIVQQRRKRGDDAPLDAESAARLPRTLYPLRVRVRHAHLEEVIESGRISFHANHQPDDHFEIARHNVDSAGNVKKRDFLTSPNEEEYFAALHAALFNGDEEETHHAISIEGTELSDSSSRKRDVLRAQEVAERRGFWSFLSKIWEAIKKIVIGAFNALKAMLGIIVDLIEFIFTGDLDILFNKSHKFDFNLMDDLNTVVSTTGDGDKDGRMAELALPNVTDDGSNGGDVAGRGSSGFYCDNCKGEIQIGIVFEVVIDRYRIQHYTASVGGITHLTFNSHVGARIEWAAQFNQVIATLRSTPWVFMVGAIPFHIQLFMPLSIIGDVSLEADARLSGEMCLQGTVEFGIHYERESGRKYIRNINLQSHGSLGKVSANVRASAKLAFDMLLVLRIDLLGGPYVRARPYVEFFGEYNTEMVATTPVGSYCNAGEHGIGVVLNAGINVVMGATLAVITENVFPALGVEKIQELTEKVNVDLAEEVGKERTFEKSAFSKKWPIIHGCHQFNRQITDLVDFRGIEPNDAEWLVVGATYNGRSRFTSQRNGGRRICRRRYVQNAQVTMQVVDAEVNGTWVSDTEKEHEYEVVMAVVSQFEAGTCYTQAMYNMKVTETYVRGDNGAMYAESVIGELDPQLDDDDYEQVQYGDCSFDRDYAGSDDDYRVHKDPKSYRAVFTQYPSHVTLTSNDRCVEVTADTVNRYPLASCAASFASRRGPCWPLPLGASASELAGWRPVGGSSALAVEGATEWFVEGGQSAKLKFGPARLYQTTPSPRIAAWSVNMVQLAQIADELARIGGQVGAGFQLGWERGAQYEELLECGRYLSTTLLHAHEYMRVVGGEEQPTSFKDVEGANLRFSVGLVFRSGEDEERVYKHEGFALDNLGLYALNFDLQGDEWIQAESKFFEGVTRELQYLDNLEAPAGQENTTVLRWNSPRIVRWANESTALPIGDRRGSFLEEILLILEWDDTNFEVGDYADSHLLVDSIQLSDKRLQPPGYACAPEPKPMYLDPCPDVSNVGSRRFSNAQEVLRIESNVANFSRTCPDGEQWIAVNPLGEEGLMWMKRSDVRGGVDDDRGACEYPPLFANMYSDNEPFTFRIGGGDGEGDSEKGFLEENLAIVIAVSAVLCCCCVVAVIMVALVAVRMSKTKSAARGAGGSAYADSPSEREPTSRRYSARYGGYSRSSSRSGGLHRGTSRTHGVQRSRNAYRQSGGLANPLATSRGY